MKKIDLEFIFCYYVNVVVRKFSSSHKELIIFV